MRTADGRHARQIPARAGRKCRGKESYSTRPSGSMNLPHWTVPFDQHQWNQNISLWESRSRLVFAFQPNSKENLETPNHWIPRFPLELGSGHPGRSRRDEPGGPESSVPGSGSGLSPFKSDPLQPATKRNQTPPWSRVESSMPSPDLANLAQK